MSEFDQFGPSGSWHPRRRPLLSLVLAVAAGMGLLMFGATEWLRYELATAPTHYPDGSVMYPDGRVVHADGRVEQRKRRIVHPDGRVEYRDWRGRDGRW